MHPLIHSYLNQTQGIVADVIRYISLNWIPDWMIRWGSDKYNEYRHQVVFLPFVPLRGSFKYKTNKPSPKAASQYNIPTSI